MFVAHTFMWIFISEVTKIKITGGWLVIIIQKHVRRCLLLICFTPVYCNSFVFVGRTKVLVTASMSMNGVINSLFDVRNSLDVKNFSLKRTGL